MSLHEDLLDQAVRLATLDAKKPKQANLRRAVSSTYYGVFHLLVDEACRVLIGAQHSQAPFRQVFSLMSPCVLSSAVSGFSRTFDEGGPSPVPEASETAEKGGPPRRLAAPDHRECGRTAIWHPFFDGKWHLTRPYDRPRSPNPTRHNIGAHYQTLPPRSEETAWSSSEPRESRTCFGVVGPTRATRLSVRKIRRRLRQRLRRTVR
jgi:hypothetical protein